MMILMAAAVLASDLQPTGKATYQETSSSAQLCRAAGYSSGCLYQERRSSSGAVQRQELSKTDWITKLQDFGVICDNYNFREGKMTIDEDDNLLNVEVIIGSGGDTCVLDGRRQFLAAGTRLIYTPTSITAFLQPIKSGFIQKLFGGELVIPNIRSSEIFPLSSQTSTRNTVKICFEGADKNSLVNAEFKNSRGEVKTISLYDDGNHYDDSPKDGCYGAVLDGLLPEGQYSVNYIINN